MKQSTTTYTKRVSARRAVVAAGIPRERVAVGSRMIPDRFVKQMRV